MPNYNILLSNKKNVVTSCCPEKRTDLGKIIWLPDPQLDERGEHYKTFDDYYGTETIEKLPSARSELKCKSKVDEK